MYFEKNEWDWSRRFVYLMRLSHFPFVRLESYLEENLTKISLLLSWGLAPKNDATLSIFHTWFIQIHFCKVQIPSEPSFCYAAGSHAAPMKNHPWLTIEESQKESSKTFEFHLDFFPKTHFHLHILTKMVWLWIGHENSQFLRLQPKVLIRRIRHFLTLLWIF